MFRKDYKDQSILKEGLDIHEHKNSEIPEFDQLDKAIDEIRENLNSICLNDDSRKVADHVAGCVAHKLQKQCKSCCEHSLIGGENATAREYSFVIEKWFKSPIGSTEQLCITGIYYIRYNFKYNS